MPLSSGWGNSEINNWNTASLLDGHSHACNLHRHIPGDVRNEQRGLRARDGTNNRFHHHVNLPPRKSCVVAAGGFRFQGGGGGVEASLANREEKIGSKETICAKHGTTKDVLVLTRKGRVGSACAHRVWCAVFSLEHLPRALRIYYIPLSSKPSKRCPRALLPHRVPPSGHEHISQHLPCG